MTTMDNSPATRKPDDHNTVKDVDYITYTSKYYARPSGDEDPFPME